MGLDMRTLIFVVGVTHIIQVVVFIHQYVITKTFRGVGWWLLWSAVEVAGFTFMLLRNIPSLQTIAIIGQNALIVLGVLFIYVGIMRFFDKKEHRGLVVSIFSVFLASLLYFLFIDDDIQVRSGIIFATLSTVSFLSAQALLANKTRKLAISVTFLAATFLAHGGYHAFRVVRWCAGIPADDVFASTPINASAYLDAIIAGTIWTFGFIIMINQRLIAEVTEAKEEIERIFNISPDAVAITRLSDGLIVNVNEGFCTMSGYTRDEVIGNTSHAVEVWKIPDDRQRITDELRKKGVCENLEVIYQQKNGRQIFGLTSAKMIYLKDVPHVISITRDITERSRMERALEHEHALKKTIIESIPGAFYMLDANGRYVHWNAYQRDEIIGKPEDQIAGTNAADTIHPDDRTLIRSRIENVLRNGAVETVEGRVLLRGGPAFRWLLMTGRQIMIDGHPFLVGIGIDITDHKRAEDELQKINKLQSIGTLAGGIAHDFNNILLGLFGNISIAMDDLSKEHPSYRPLEEAEKSMGRAVRLTKQLLTFAKGGAPVKENVSLVAMVEESARFDLTGSNVSLVFHHDSDLWPVDADKGQIQQVISNLVINARQAMPSGGHLRIALENADLPATTIPGLSAGRYVKVIVQDEGGGIEPKVIGHIFDPYFSTKQTGSGLGLATVWSIINKHGGHIGVESEVFKGTTFTFYLPASASPQSADAKPLAAECPVPARPAKILVMDDEKMVCDLASKMLSRYGYSVATAPDAQEVIELYRQALEAGAPFDLVIMDLTIPGGPGGKEVIQDLLALDPHVRAIVSSGYADDPVMANPAKYGFKGSAAKPYTARTLRDAVARVLA